MRIGIPKELKTLEKRIAIVPNTVKELVSSGHTVRIQEDAGKGSGFSNEELKDAGAEIVPTLKDVWADVDLLVKVKEPDPEEFQFFREDLMLFDYLHLAGMPDVTEAMLEGRVASIAYELVTDENGRLPLLEPMSVVAGKLSIVNGSNCLLSQNNGRGVLLSGAASAPPGHVVIVGCGIAGTAACENAVGLGARVTMLDINEERLAGLKKRFGDAINTVKSTPASLKEACSTADLLVGAVLVPGAAAPKVITREIIEAMPEGSVLVDISIDQGGCAETIRTTSLAEPTYVESGVIHYAVPNMPAQTPRTSTQALTAVTAPYLLELANKGIDAALKDSKELRGALHTWKGLLTNKEVAEALSISFTPIDEALAR